MPELEVDERSARIRVGVRRSLAAEVRLEEHSVGAGRHGGCLAVEFLVRGTRRERSAVPAERAGRGEHHPHRVPRAGNGVAEDVDARLRVGLVARKDGEDDAGGAEDDRDRAGPVDPDAERRGRLVARAGDLGRLADLREPRARNL